MKQGEKPLFWQFWQELTKKRQNEVILDIFLDEFVAVFLLQLSEHQNQVQDQLRYLQYLNRGAP